MTGWQRVLQQEMAQSTIVVRMRPSRVLVRRNLGLGSRFRMVMMMLASRMSMSRRSGNRGFRVFVSRMFMRVNDGRR